MQFYRPGQLPLTHLSAWLLKPILPGWNADRMRVKKDWRQHGRLHCYRTGHYNGYDITQPRDKSFVALSNEVVYAADNYQRYQGLKLVNRFNAICYYRLSQSMDSHDVGKNRGGVEKALKKITAKTLVIGITSDVLYPITEQEYLQKTIRGAELLSICQRFWS